MKADMKPKRPRPRLDHALTWQRCGPPQKYWHELGRVPFSEHGRSGVEIMFQTSQGFRSYRRYGEGRGAYWCKLVRRIR